MVFYAMFACTPLLVALAVKLYYQCPINESKRAKRAFLIFSGLILWLVIALRDKAVGSTDSGIYYDRWENMSFRNLDGLKENMLKSRMEPVFLCTVWLLSHIFPHPQFIFVISGLVFTASLCYFIYHNSDNVVISFVMFITWGLYSFMVQGLRQALAMSICLFSIEPAKKRKFFRFLLLILLAVCYHKSAMIFTIVYFMPWKRLSLVNKLQMFLASLVLVACSGLITYVGNTYLGGYYTETIEDGGYVALLMYVIILMGGIFFVQHYKTVDGEDYKVVLLGSEEERRNETMFFALTVIGFSFFFMRYTGVGILERISFYFQFGQIILLPCIVKRFDKNSQSIAYSAVVILSVLLFMYRVETIGLTPFKFFFLD